MSAHLLSKSSTTSTDASASPSAITTPTPGATADNMGLTAFASNPTGQGDHANTPETNITRSSSLDQSPNTRKRSLDSTLQEISDNSTTLNLPPHEVMNANTCNTSSEPQTKIVKFQNTPLDDNIDYNALTSALSLLESRLDRIKREIKDLKEFKNTIRNAKDLKDTKATITSNDNYLKEISYKGVVVKCPIINWKRDYDVDIDKLKDPEMLMKYGKENIGQRYEIIRRGSVFN